MATGEFRPGNAIKLLTSGAEYFPALTEAIGNARQEIFLETYIFADDPTGRRIADALVAAAARGVKTRVVIDGFGSSGYIGKLHTQMRANGIEVLVFRPEVSRLSFKRQRLRRLHRKIAVVDAKIAFVGGINIIDDMHAPRQIPPRYDYAVRIEGPLLQDIYPVVARLWRLLRWTNLRRRRLAPPLLTPITTAVGDKTAAFLIRDNLRHRRDIEEAYLNALEGAQHDVVIANAYFLPGLRFRHALIAAAQRGVRVVLLLQGRVEYFLLHYASRALYGSLLAGGVEILEYRKSFMHAKVAVVDRKWSTVGSSNIDPFSLMLAREANVVIDDQKFACELRDSLHKAMEEGAVPIGVRWHSRPLIDRMLTWSCYGGARFLMGIFGYGQR
ncbi:MAG: cardiolipin synthase ClsB [Burkholderiales bacterium]|nr:cardiolipin synthase ClsB [Burkholderiales bacterium]